jgi:8-oxo-dGTP pyrophosphatase MutT (NUDIX family)/phosphohistidine phosphatase SixA
VTGWTDIAAPLAADERSTSVEAAGGVLWRADGAVQVALVHRPRYGDWSLPKGKLVDGEHPLLAAVREVAEETGIACVPGRPLGEIRYQVEGMPKRVRYWALQAGSGGFVPTAEVDRVDWLQVGDALQRLAPDHDRPILERFDEQPPASWPCVLLRHGRAGNKANWSGDDRDRPLDSVGQRQAEGARRVLGVYQPERIVAADVARCRQTVAPLAEAAGLPVTPEPQLTEKAFAGGPERAIATLVDLALTGRSTVACSQGKAIPGLLRGLCQRFGVVPPLDPTVRKGGAWVVHLADRTAPRIVALERFPPWPADPPE